MADESYNEVGLSEYTQLTQIKVPLVEAAEAFSLRDESGRIPIIIVPQHLNRIRNDLILLSVVILAAGIIGGIFLNSQLLISLAIPLFVVLLILGVYRSFIVRVPEGANALLTRGGRYTRTIGSGTNLLPPWIIVSHLVTRREIPFDVPLVASPTKDNVRADVDTLITFSITDPYKFVYSISASDFDQVFQAASQDALRALIRQITTEEVIDLKRQKMSDLVESLGADVEPYGVKVMKINVTYAQPPNDFMHSQEMSKLAIIQQAEQEQKQALAIRRQSDAEELAQQEVIARMKRNREELEVRYQEAEARRRVVEMEAETEEYRLDRLQERLEKFPVATQYELELARLEIAQSLAGNTRAMLQVGTADDIVKAFMMRDVLHDKPLTNLLESEEAASDEETAAPSVAAVEPPPVKENDKSAET